jgi:uncharacterized protein (TIGR00252 family)
MTVTTEVGQRAEKAVAHELARKGYQIIERNWKTKFCEVDIIAARHQVIYFVEVKYRRSIGAGGGLDYITPAKLLHMTRAARLWVATQRYSGEHQLAAVEVSGPNFIVGDLVELED